ELNAVAVEQNRRAFLWGRVAIANPGALRSVTAASEHTERLPETFEEIVSHREAHLTAWQNRAHAAAFRAAVDRIAEREQSIAPGRRDLSRAVAIGLSRLMAYKDEYEVARLFVEGRFKRELDAQLDRKSTRLNSSHVKISYA